MIVPKGAGSHAAPVTIDAMQPGESVVEFTLKAVVVGVLLGLVFGAANAYLGLRVGLTVSASIPAAVMTVAVFRLLQQPSTLLEANLSQTIASASTSLATGTIFTIPALFLWGTIPPYLQVVVLAFLGGLLGLAAMIPLRRLLIVQGQRELPYPEGAACAEVLRASVAGGGQAVRQSRWIFRGIAVGAAVKILISLLFVMPEELRLALPVLPRAELALEVAPALIGVGYILGYRMAAVCVAGALISSVMITPLIAWIGAGLQSPLYPETTRLVMEMDAGAIWSRYVRYIGAGAVATAGLVTVLRGLPAMYGSFTAISQGLRGSPTGQQAAGGSERTDRDLPPSFIFASVAAVVLIAGLVPGVFAGEMSGVQRAVLAAGVGIFGVMFVAVAARIVGIVGVSSQPTSGIALVTLLGTASVFAAAGWITPEARAGVLTVGTIVAIAASKAGDISQDLKTGWLLGATPARQQLGQLIGASVACWAVAATVLMLGEAYEFGSKELPAPQAMLMKTIIDGVLAGSLPWDLVLTGAGLSIGAMLCGISGLAFAIGVYLPLAAMAPLFVGGCVRAWVVRRGRTEARAEHESSPGILAASGLVAGEALAGVLIAGLVATGVAPASLDVRLGSAPGQLVALAAVVLVCAFILSSEATRRFPE
jgi:putative OPT family oligopeptide transporter